VRKGVPLVSLDSSEIGAQLAAVGAELNLNRSRMKRAEELFAKHFISAQALDGSSVAVNVPTHPAQRVAFVARIENLELDPGDAAAKVIVNSRTGTIVIGQHVQVTAAAVTHGSLTVTISNNPIISQPPPLSDGATVVVPKRDIDVKQERNRMFLFNPGVKLDDIVRAVNAVGAAPGDLVAILEALKEAGALKAELVVI